MSAPHRVQLRRRKGWRMPANTEKVEHTTRYGTPFVVHASCDYGVEVGEVCCRRRRHSGVYIHVATSAEAVARFRATPRSHDEIALIREQLRGRNLACWCPLDQPCHADFLLEIANRERP